jgi:hypothetical protein
MFEQLEAPIGGDAVSNAKISHTAVASIQSSIQLAFSIRSSLKYKKTKGLRILRFFFEFSPTFEEIRRNHQGIPISSFYSFAP